MIALTFDDGPDPASTPGVLDALAGHNVHATFFVLAGRARAHPALIRRMVRDGHEVALHGEDHTRVTNLDTAVLARVLDEARASIEAITGTSIAWYRPPYGAQSLRSYLTVRRTGLDVAAWSHDCADWLPQPIERIAAAAGAGLQPGRIVLLHDALETDPANPTPATHFDRGAMTEAVLASVRTAGFAAGSLRELLTCGRARRSAWFRP